MMFARSPPLSLHSTQKRSAWMGGRFSGARRPRTKRLKDGAALTESEDDKKSGASSSSQQMMSAAEEELAYHQSIGNAGGLPFDADTASHRSSFSMSQRGSPTRHGKGNCDDRLSGFDELKATLDTTFEIFESSEGKDPLAPRSGLVDLVPLRSALVELIRKFGPLPGELDKYALFDFSKPYTRNCIAQTNKYTLLLLCWNPAAESRIHDHPCDACILTVLDGILKEERYGSGLEGRGEVPVGQQASEPSATRFYMQGQVSFMTDDMGLHKIYNPNKTQPAISLHLYYPPFAACTCWPQTPDGTVQGKELVKIGTFSYRGIRTPHAEGRMSSHGQVMLELQRKRKLIL